MIYLDDKRQPISREEYIALQKRADLAAVRSTPASPPPAPPDPAPDPARAPAAAPSAPSAAHLALRAQLEAEIAETHRAVEAERRAVIGHMARADHTAEEAAVLQACLDDPSCTPAEASRRLAPATAARILRNHCSSTGRSL
jgi:hypothetical protein